MQGDGGDICLNSALPNMKRCCTLSTYYLVLFHSLNEREDGPWTPQNPALVSEVWVFLRSQGW